MSLPLDRPTKFGGGLSAVAQPDKDQRRERRYKVGLPGEIHFGDAVWPVLVSDLSPSGALITAAGADVSWEAGNHMLLVLREFGAIKARVAHAGSDFYGLQFLDPHLHRDTLAVWLQTKVDAS